MPVLETPAPRPSRTTSASGATADQPPAFAPASALSAGKGSVKAAVWHAGDRVGGGGGGGGGTACVADGDVVIASSGACGVEKGKAEEEQVRGN